MERPRITVLMAIYNCGPYLAEALDSLLSQTYQGFKVILCDDGSTDNTYDIARQYTDRHPDKFILLKNERNLKLPATLNRCAEYADTEYIARMDGDDISLPERFEKEIEFLDAHPEYALVSCPMIFFDENGDYRTGKAIERPTKEDFRYCSPFCHAPVLMRREAFEAIGRYTAEPWVLRAEDYYLWYKYYKAGYYGYNLSIPLYKMRNGREAISRRTAKTRWNGCKLDIKIMKGLGLGHPYLTAIPRLAKILVPNWGVRLIYNIKYRH